MVNKIDRRQIKEYYAVWLEMEQLYQEWAKRFGLSYHSLFTLYGIWEMQEECTQKRICDEWLMPKQTVNAILKKFQKEGYIIYKTNERDRRNKNISLTKQGELFAAEIIGKLTQLEMAAMKKMGDEEWEIMQKSNRRVVELLRSEIPHS